LEVIESHLILAKDHQRLWFGSYKNWCLHIL
jgi:hypothetical protein